MPTENQEALQHRQLELLLASARKTLAIGTCAILLAAGLLYGEISNAALGIWLVAGIALAGLRFLAINFAKSASENPGELKKRCVLYSLSLFATGCHWGSLMLFFSSAAEPATQILLLLFPIALAAGAVSGYGAWLPAYLAFMLPCQLPVIAVFLFANGYGGIAAPGILYIGGLFLLSSQFQKSVRESIKLQLENQGLIENLSQQNSQLEVAIDDAHCASKAKSAFLATMSHEIRTPMNGVLGMTQLLLNSNLDSTQRHYGETIRRSAESLLLIINDVLDFSKIEADRVELEAIAFEPHQIVDDVCLLMKGNTSGKSLDVTYEISETVPPVLLGDPLRLKQILINLMGNAIKFTSEGVVHVVVDVVDSTSQASSKEASCTLRFAVSDTGIGIPPESLEAIFQEFSQADGSTTRNFGGTGLGLTISRRLARLMDGDITAVSEIGKGSTFTLQAVFPVVSEGQVDSSPGLAKDYPSDQQPAESNSVTNGLRVLLAEDSPVNQEVAQAMLTMLGCDVVCVSNGREAVEAVEATLASEASDASSPVFDLILMDCQMPVLDGYEATAIIRQLPSSTVSAIPIVALTANAMIGDREACLAAGMDDYLSKPFSADDLELVVKRNCTGASGDELRLAA